MGRSNNKRLRSLALDEGGETIVETLVSVLISTLALLVLATAISSAVNMIGSSRNYMENHYSSENGLVSNYSNTSSSTGSVIQETQMEASVELIREANPDSTPTVSKEITVIAHISSQGNVAYYTINE